MHFSLIPINSTSAVFTTDKNKIGYVFRDSNFHGYNDLSNFWSLLLFYVSHVLQGDPKRLLGLFKPTHNVMFRRYYHGRMSSVTSKKNVEHYILEHHVFKNPSLHNKLFPNTKYVAGKEINWDLADENLKSLLEDFIEQNIITNCANHGGLNTSYHYESEALISCSLRIGHNLTFDPNPVNNLTNECIPVIPLGMNNGQMQYITQNMSIFTPIATRYLMFEGQDIIRQNEALYHKYAETILQLIKNGELQPIICSLFIKNKNLALCEDKINQLLTEQSQPIILPFTDKLVSFAIEEEAALAKYLLELAKTFTDSID